MDAEHSHFFWYFDFYFDQRNPSPSEIALLLQWAQRFASLVIVLPSVKTNVPIQDIWYNRHKKYSVHQRHISSWHIFNVLVKNIILSIHRNNSGHHLWFLVADPPPEIKWHNGILPALPYPAWWQWDKNKYQVMGVWGGEGSRRGCGI